MRERDGRDNIPDDHSLPDSASLTAASDEHSVTYSSSFGQHRLWFMQCLEPESSTYSVPLALRLRGRLDVAALQRAVDAVVFRHEVLRTSLAGRAGVPQQVVSESCAVPVELCDLSVVTDAEARERRLAALVDEVAAQPFDLAVAPLMRVVVARVGVAEHVFVLNMHHAITDGVSFGVLGKELSELYTAFVSGRDAVLDDLPIQYGDFAEWQRDMMSAGLWSDQLDFWQRELEDWPTVLDLPTDRARPAVRTSRGAAVELHVPGPTAAAVRRLSRQLGGTVHMTLMTAFQAFLYQLSGQERFTVGTTVAGRSPAVVEDLIGFFVNTLPVRADCRGSPSFAEAFSRVQQSLLGAYANQEMPFDQIVQAVRPKRDLSRTPLFQVILTYASDPLREFKLPGAVSEHYPVLQSVARCDLSVEITDIGESFRVVFEYSSDLFDPATMKRYSDMFLRLLDHFAAIPLGSRKDKSGP